MTLTAVLSAYSLPLIVCATDGTPIRSLPSVESAIVSIGPEGGWSEEDLALFHQANATSVSLGSRLLRTETAAIVASYELLRGTLMILHTIILGIIEGVTEFIPVSSTAHLLLTGQLFGIQSGVFLEALSISIQSGAILAAVWYFWRTVWANRTLIPKVTLAFYPHCTCGGSPLSDYQTALCKYSYYRARTYSWRDRTSFYQNA